MKGRGLSHIGVVQAVVLMALVGAALAFPRAVGAYLYWGENQSVARANLGGGGVRSLIAHTGRGGIDGVAVSPRYIFFAGGQGVIGRANLNGSDVHPDLINIPQPTLNGVLQREANAGDLAVAGAYVYWSSTSLESIGRASVDGGEVDANLIPVEGFVFGISIYAGHIYWVTNHAIGRAKLDGSNVEPSFIPLVGMGGGGIAVAHGYIYWTPYSGGTISRASITDRKVDPEFVTDLGEVANLAVAGNHIYWVSGSGYYGAPRRQWIGRSSLTGGDVQRHLINVSDLITGRLVANAVQAQGPKPDGTQHRSN